MMSTRFRPVALVSLLVTSVASCASDGPSNAPAPECTGGKSEYNVPVLHPTATETPDLAMHYFVDHYTSKARQGQDTKDTPEGVLYPRGGALGGSTAINAMITVAPQNSDWNYIAQLTGD